METQTPSDDSPDWPLTEASRIGTGPAAGIFSVLSRPDVTGNAENQTREQA